MLIKKLFLSFLVFAISLFLWISITYFAWFPVLSYLRSLNLDPAIIMGIMYGAQALLLILLSVGLYSYSGVFKVDVGGKKDLSA